MKEPYLVIRKETLPVRCEICHQSDLFEPETGVCERCAEVSPHRKKKFELHIRDSEVPTPRWVLPALRILTIGGYIVGGVFSLIGGNLCRFPERGEGEIPYLGNQLGGFICCIGAIISFFLAVLWGLFWIAAKKNKTEQKTHP